ncbi:hypothetical protein B0H94_109146 [Salsuginibacillus halophilus]|uniref:Uncharacterized protein n=1 Tax=Salsuginibacillus halophilus TaxID=517424 RepID=A0A2P8HCW5_9BACI|nr:hypothetical protein [Salsuginibacillus halophilus]PSL44084.1 hypothetical protein B0H94_109146 [Salsuginibacillus halophilus]
MDMTGEEMVMNRKTLALKKVEKIKKGQAAFADASELADMIRRELNRQQLTVYEDVTELGYWFLPEGN